MSKMLVIAVHPDDETLGCGGAILKHIDSGDEVYWLIVTNVREDDGWSREKVEERRKEIEEVSRIYGFAGIYKLDLPTTKLDTLPLGELIKSISEVLESVKPETVYLPGRNDVHTDHQVTHQAALSALKNFRAPYVKRCLMYECLSETEFSLPLPEEAFTPNVFVDISDYFDRKLEAMNVYRSEIMEGPLPRNPEVIRSLAKYRGSRIGCEYAEAFMLLLEKR